MTVKPDNPLPIPTGGHHDALVAQLSAALRNWNPFHADEFTMTFSSLLDEEIDAELAEWDAILHPKI